MNNTLTIMVGLPRSGKSTWIENNKGKAIVVSHDWIRENILGTHYSSASNAIIWSLSDAALRIILSQDKDVILDGLNNNAFVRKFYVDIAKKYGAKIKFVCLSTPLAICLFRNEKAETNKLPKEKLIAIDKDFEWVKEGELGDGASMSWVDGFSTDELFNRLYFKEM
jgi:predicted kinase